jgi:cation diffusion facilitator family transporter
VLGNSGALIADGIHSFSDLLSDGVVLYATKHSAEEADEEHPYGHERFETVATLGLAIILAIVAIGIIIDGFERLNNPSSLSHNTLLLSVALRQLLRQSVWWRIVLRHQTTNLRTNGCHQR